MRSFIFAASLLLTTPAFATEWIYCGDADQKASVGVLMGGAGFVNISAVTLNVPGKDWASSETYGPGDAVWYSESYVSNNQIIIDLTDDQSSEILAELRVYLAEEGEDYVQGGVLRVPGHGAWVVSCEGP